jgi:predicted acylesterase/phospholipase RssA
MATNHELCLLSLDGGGVRGLSTLLILKRLLEAINPEDPPKPCDYFHMICGTSTGGLIALMLGRMRLTIDQCIAAYNEMSPLIFTKLHHRINLKNGESQGRFDHKALEEGVKSVLVQYGFDPEELLKDRIAMGSCKT